jgi:hypothetical protein
VSKMFRLTMATAKVGKRIAGKRDRRSEQEAPAGDHDGLQHGLDAWAG